ncbi:hypothetical protein NCAS_0F00610 [Naumovozyma castellii]|uniref:Uncharacterized protein n=1 Tax=Naumovozyma castellii TaxID=27288 RepID=G0VGC5_NAUCA|nr:hypothetical protein NCAS_0F00610 [Naumovozyma castellii CBS 4309]CCC70545.1 hypothetical protein NCAS_0F00610 [Naumovozyma castellii CBS 4309]
MSYSSIKPNVHPPTIVDSSDTIPEEKSPLGQETSEQIGGSTTWKIKQEPALSSSSSYKLTSKFQHNSLHSNALHKSIFKRQILQKQTASHLNKHNEIKLKLKLKNKFFSPTDKLLSPCSQKLTSHKSKLFTAKSNPTKLNFAMSKLNNDDILMTGSDDDENY